MKFIYAYAIWMIAAMVARLAELIAKQTFESIVITGIVFAAGISYKSLCEAHYAFDKRHARSL
ncbi:hypothetical protein HYY73_03940 [Candidatus Woesearchaeota archaeon]|nr:hypothetical protein [Candidatus Woesearchaeota archaeon]